MPVLIAEKQIDKKWSVEEFNTYAEARELLAVKAKIYPAALLHKAKTGKLIIFEGKPRAAEHIIQQILDEED